MPLNIGQSIKRKGSSSYRGVQRYKGKWRAMIAHGYGVYHIGVYETELEAARAYNRKAREFKGMGAVLNEV